MTNWTTNMWGYLFRGLHIHCEVICQIVLQNPNQSQFNTFIQWKLQFSFFHQSIKVGKNSMEDNKWWKVWMLGSVRTWRQWYTLSTFFVIRNDKKKWVAWPSMIPFTLDDKQIMSLSSRTNLPLDLISYYSSE